jgi:hypothetical protein
MAQSVAALYHGWEYQARLFWIHASRMFQDRPKVQRVGFENDEIRSFDDITVHYEGLVESGEPVNADFYQVKFHMTGGAIRNEDFADPAFINAKSHSLLHRLRDAKMKLGAKSVARFRLYTPWRIHPDDPLIEAFSNVDNSFRWDVLSAGKTPNSKFGAIRKLWRDHLGLHDDEELAAVLRAFRLESGLTLLEIERELNLRLACFGFVPVTEGSLLHPYEQVVSKLFTSGRNEFRREDIERLCGQEGLWIGRSMPEPDALRVGIRSFIRWAEHLEDQTDAFLDLVPHFDGRYIKSPQYWQTRLWPEIEAFVGNTFRPTSRFHIYLPAHLTIAHAAGYLLDARSGIDVAPVQTSVGGTDIWRPKPGIPYGSYPGWRFEDCPCQGSGVEVALAISVSRQISEDVRYFVGRHLPSVHRLISCSIEPAPGQRAVLNADHARALADTLVERVKTMRTPEERTAPLHIFAAAPVGFAFFLGQMARGFGSHVLYEFDFEANTPDGYSPSLAFPPLKTGSTNLKGVPTE